MALEHQGRHGGGGLEESMSTWPWGTEKGRQPSPNMTRCWGVSPRRPGWSAGRPPQASVQPGSLAGCRKDLPEISYSEDELQAGRLVSQKRRRLVGQ